MRKGYEAGCTRDAKKAEKPNRSFVATWISKDEVDADLLAEIE